MKWLPRLVIMAVFASLIYVGAVGYLKIQKADDPVPEAEAVYVETAKPEPVVDTLVTEVDSLANEETQLDQ